MAGKTGAKRVDWPRWDHLLGTKRDDEIAAVIGCTKMTVTVHRGRLGIPPPVNSTWTAEDESLFAQGRAKCVRCGEIKELPAFPGDRSARTSVKRACRDCVNGATKRYADDNKRHWIDQMGGACQNCGENRFISALDFHHVDGDEKDANPSLFIARRSRWEEAAKELDKCCLLCSNCHRALHGGELSLNFVKRAGLGWTIERSVTS